MFIVDAIWVTIAEWRREVIRKDLLTGIEAQWVIDSTLGKWGERPHPEEKKHE